MLLSLITVEGQPLLEPIRNHSSFDPRPWYPSQETFGVSKQCGYD